MKIISLKSNVPNNKSKGIRNLLTDLLKKDLDIFKSTSRQFLQNNPDYYPTANGLIA